LAKARLFSLAATSTQTFDRDFPQENIVVEGLGVARTRAGACSEHAAVEERNEVERFFIPDKKTKPLLVVSLAGCKL